MTISHYKLHYSVKVLPRLIMAFKVLKPPQTGGGDYCDSIGPSDLRV